MVYQEHTSTAQPPQNDSKHAYRVVGPRCQCGKIKIGSVKVRIERLNDKKGKNGKRTYPEHIWTTQPPENTLKRCYRDVGHRQWKHRMPRLHTSFKALAKGTSAKHAEMTRRSTEWLHWMENQQRELVMSTRVMKW